MVDNNVESGPLTNDEKEWYEEAQNAVNAKPVSKPVKKPPFKKLDMNALLDMSCWNPENFSEFEEWTAKQQEILEDPDKDFKDVPPFAGWRRYSIVLHCNEVIVIARKHPANGGYQIRDYLVQDH